MSSFGQHKIPGGIYIRKEREARPTHDHFTLGLYISCVSSSTFELQYCVGVCLVGCWFVVVGVFLCIVFVLFLVGVGDPCIIISYLLSHRNSYEFISTMITRQNYGL